jgi:hypothetical protein
LKLLSIPKRIWSELLIDFITRLPLSGPNKVDSIIVITDRLLKNVIFEAIALTIVEVVADRLLYYLIYHHGIPSIIVLDRGS